MALVAAYQDARLVEGVARLRRALALRALIATGASQREIAEALGVSQPAISQQLSAARSAIEVHPEVLLTAAAPILVELAQDRGFANLAVFGSVARHEAQDDSDIDLIVTAPRGAGIKELLGLQQLFEATLGRPIDLATYGGLKPTIDDDIRAEAVML